LAALALTVAPVGAAYQMASSPDGDDTGMARSISGYAEYASSADTLPTEPFLYELLPPDQSQTATAQRGPHLNIDEFYLKFTYPADIVDSVAGFYDETDLPAEIDDSNPDTPAVLPALTVQELLADSPDVDDAQTHEFQVVIAPHVPIGENPEPDPAPESTKDEEALSADSHGDALTEEGDYVEEETVGFGAHFFDGVAEFPVTASTGAYIWPTQGNLSSRFGRRSTSVGSTNHKGIDITGPFGHPIYAADGGEVIVSGWSSSFGLVVEIRHDNGHVTLYSHCSELLVGVGERVRQGQQIAQMGRTGIASGIHLHFELIINGVNVDPLLHLPPILITAAENN